MVENTGKVIGRSWKNKDTRRLEKGKREKELWWGISSYLTGF
jgi:hypothetical protein